MTDLSSWVSDNAKKPVMRLMVLAAAVQFLYLAYLVHSRYSGQIDRVDQMLQTITLGVQQSNRALIEATFVSELSNLEVVAAALCSGGVARISYPPGDAEYCKIGVGNLRYWPLRRKLEGMGDLELLVVLSPISVFGPLIFLMMVSLSALVGVLWTISRLQTRLRLEILYPLVEGLTRTEPLGVIELDELRRKNLNHIQLVKEKSLSDALVNISAQVAHDIRSPLAALGAAAKGLSSDAEQRKLIEGAVGRMQGIADDLLARYRSPGAAQQPAAKPVAMRLAGIVEQVVEEKRLQHAGRAGVKINFESAGGDIKAAVEAKELQRAISNLVNNAVEAFEKDGTVLVKVFALDGQVIVKVQDDGKGIPADILAKLGGKGETHGKAGGTGLGLYHAKTSAESWGGCLKIESEPGKGTTITMALPRAGASDSAHKSVVLLDDDQLVHMNWKMAARAAGAEIKTFKTGEELKAAAETLPKDIPVYIDAELGDGVRGEEVAEWLRERGFKDISMATGHAPDKFAGLPWLKVRGKEPPWGVK
jgi:signal transduction histidine kinase